MREALRIFGKDVRHLWWPQIAVTLALLALYCSQDSDVRTLSQFDLMSVLVTPLVLLAAWFLIASVMQDEALPGNRQFWLTRPFPRASLLAAKALFIVAFLNLPVLLSQVFTLALNGVSPFHFLLLLLRRQVLFTIWVILPAVALAVVTRGIAQFALGSLGLGLLLLPLVRIDAQDWGGVEPVRTWTAAVVVLLSAGLILALQYRRRRTAAAWAVLACGTLLLDAAPFLPLPSAAVALQSWFSPQPAAVSDIRLVFDPRDLPEHPPDYPKVGVEAVDIQIPLRLTGVPEGWDVEGEAVEVRVEAAGEKAWQSSWKLRPFRKHSGSLYQVAIPMNSTLWQDSQVSAVHLHARFALTLLTPARTTPIETSVAPGPPSEPDELGGVGGGAVGWSFVSGGEKMRLTPRAGSGPCGVSEHQRVIAMVACLEPLHRPARMSLAGGDLEAAGSPFLWSGSGSGLSVWRIATAMRMPNRGPGVTVKVREAASHFVVDLDLPGFPLTRCPLDLSPEVGFSFSTGWGDLF